MLLTLNGKQIPEKWIDYPYVRIPKQELTLNPNYVPKFTKKGKELPNEKYYFGDTLIKPGVVFNPNKDFINTHKIRRIIERKKYLRICLIAYDGRPLQNTRIGNYWGVPHWKRFPNAEARDFDGLPETLLEVHKDCILKGKYPFHKIFDAFARFQSPLPGDKGELRILLDITKRDFIMRHVDIDTDMTVHFNGKEYRVDDCRYNKYPKYAILLISETGRAA